jgi:hypothetical protein
MADNNDDDDIYNDPQTIGGTNDDLSGAPDNDVPDEDDDLSDSIYLPEKNTTDLDDRGPIDELELADSKDSDIADTDPTVDWATLDDEPSDELDSDSYDPAGEVIADEQDGTDPV